MAEGLVIVALFVAWVLFVVLVIRADARDERAYQAWYDAQPWSSRSLAAKPTDAKPDEQEQP